MARGDWPVLVIGVALALVAAACGDDGDGEAFTTTTAGSGDSIAAGTTTTEAWGEAVAAGGEALVSGSGVLLREDFQDGDTAGWLVEAGWYVLENGGRRMAAAGGEAWAWYLGGLGWARYGVRLGFLVNAGSLGVSVAVGEEGRYVVQFSEQGVYLLKDAPYGSVQALGSAQPVSLGEPHVLAVGVDGGHLQVYVDGVLLIDATDPSPLPGGSVGLGAGAGSAVVVDNIVVASLGGPLPQIQAVAEPADQPLPDEFADGAPGAGEELDEGGEPPDPSIPNLVLSGVSYPSVIGYGQPFEVLLTVANASGVEVGAFTVAFTSEGETCEAEVNSLAAGEGAMVSCRMPGYAANGSEFYDWVAAADSGGVIDEGGREDDNLAAGTITIGEGQSEEVLPNVTFGWVSTRPDMPQPGEPIAKDVSIVQTNLAWTGTLPDLELRVFYEDGSAACGATIPSGETTGTCDIPAFSNPGVYRLRFVIDADDVFAEADEEDNTLWGTTTVFELSPVELPNLHLGGIAGGILLDPASLHAWQPFTASISYEAENWPETVSSFTIRLMIDDIVVCSWDTALGSEVLACDIAGLSVGTHQWGVHLDADNDIAESDEGDNDRYGQFTVQV
jgi:hypothetical protein